MQQSKLDFLQVMEERGFVHQCTDLEGLRALGKKEPITAYIGFDCTATSLHVGSLIQIMVLRWLQKTGHRPVVLMGGGTTKVGDPSGKDEARKLLDDAAIAGNIAGIKTVFEKFLRFEGENAAQMVNNDDWLSGLNYIAFLRDYGQHFSVNRMLSFDSVKLRLEREQSLSFLEFNYMILQAYDFVELNKRNGCRLQIGGSDQWGNIINGVELNRRLGRAEIFGLTTPLLTTASGAKMGKTASGAVWLNADMLSSYDYWQYWRNTEDADVGKFLKLFTELSLEEISKLEQLQGAEINEAKKILANEATALAHGREAAEAAAETARKTFEEGQTGDALPEISVELSQGIPLYELVRQSGLASSNGEARKLVRGKGIKLNDVTAEDENMVVTTELVQSAGHIKLSAGKKRHILVKPS